MAGWAQAWLPTPTPLSASLPVHVPCTPLPPPGLGTECLTSPVYSFLLCLSMSDCEDLSRPWALTCYSQLLFTVLPGGSHPLDLLSVTLALRLRCFSFLFCGLGLGGQTRDIQSEALQGPGQCSPTLGTVLALPLLHTYRGRFSYSSLPLWNRGPPPPA